MKFRLLAGLLIIAGCGPSEERTISRFDGTSVSPGSCDSTPCSIAVSSPTVTLRGDPTGASDPMFPVVESPWGGFLSGAYNGEGRLLVWDADGDLIRTLGEEGDGPGESHGTVGALVDDQDRIHILGMRGRWSVFSDSLKFLFSVQGVFAPPGLNVLVDDTTVVSGWAGFSQFRVTSLTGGTQSELGRTYETSDIPPPWTIAKADSPGEFWSIDAGGNRVERWDRSGDRLESIVPISEVFTPPSTAYDSHVPQPHYFLDLRVRGDLIWLVGGVRDSADADADPRLFVEVLDRRSGESLAHGYEGGGNRIIHGFVNDTLGWVTVEQSNGLSRIELRRIGLVRR